MNRKEDFMTLYKTYICRPGADSLLQWLEESDFFTAPASTRFHGDYAGGLCDHSVNVWEELIRLLKAYPEIKVSAETAAIVSLLHDVCKVGCYKTELRNKKVNGVWVQQPTYVFQEDFCYGGHGSKSVYLIHKYMPLSEAEAVAINCHMGFADRSPGDYSLGGAYEQHPLAWLLHVADESATYIRESNM
ncbi:MAG: hydrolase [Clostridia bacterium]|nr:hydrolase [Clostridia bacterium]